MRDHRIGSGRPPKVWGGSHCLLDRWHTHPEILMAMHLEVRDHPFNKTPTDQCIDDPFVTPTPRIAAGSSSGDAGSSPTAQMLMQRREYRSSQPHHGLSDQDETSSQTLVQVPTRHPFRPPQPANRNGTANPTTLDIGHAPPMVQGIPLVPATELPDRFRSLFKFPIFNAVQSKSFSVAYGMDDNLVLSAPTGSGKTVVMELAICRLMASQANSSFKVIYQAPTKSLCAERFRDWQARFGALDLQCAELTGDTDFNQLKAVQNASIIITTPEKWDSVTRKWKDHAKLMQLVKLFLVDEVHILKDTRGATLEAVVSRMKSVGSNVRFVALSATVPNSEDIATWLGRNSTCQYLPAHREVFGEEFRPVQLQKFVYGYTAKQNEFVFDTILTNKLPEIIARHSNRKSILIFCFTRSSTIKTAKSLAELWCATSESQRLWPKPRRQIQAMDVELRHVTAAGVAFHQAGLDLGDRRAVEQGFLSGDISIICATSTLAVGVNLPCYLAIIKNTVCYTEAGIQEYPDLEMMQMLGRAGRPQFESSARAVILTRNEQVEQYKKMVAGRELLESSLHLNLIDHLNAEISLGTVFDIPSAMRWLGGTFLFVRLKKNPGHYQLKEGDDFRCRDEDELIQHICKKDIKMLQDVELVSSQGKLRCSEFGDAMARYCIKFETMKIILSLPPKAKMSEIISVLAQADEFRNIRFKASEKSLYRDLSKNASIKFPIKVDIALLAHKISLLIQAELGGTDFPVADQFKKHKVAFMQDKAVVFQHVDRLIRCIIDCQLYLQDSVSARHALELGRSLAARVWDSSPLQLKQLEGIGNVYVRKLAGASIKSLESLENIEPYCIETVLLKNPPFGMKLLDKLADFPKLRVSMKQAGKEKRAGEHVEVTINAKIGFINQKVPLWFKKKPIYVCFLAETSDGILVDFRRMHARKIQNELEIPFSASLTKPTNHIACHVMCDEIAGTGRSAQLKLDRIPVHLFPALKPLDQASSLRRRGLIGDFRSAPDVVEHAEDYGDDELDDGAMLAAVAGGGGDIEVMDIDEVMPDKQRAHSNNTAWNQTKKTGSRTKQADSSSTEEPVRLENGRWACNHTCKQEGKECKHKCCLEGIEKPRKPAKRKAVQEDNQLETTAKSDVPPKKKPRTPFESAHSAFEEEKKNRHQKLGPNESLSLDKLHKATGNFASLTKQSPQKHEHEVRTAMDQQPAVQETAQASSNDTSWLDDLDLADLPSTTDLFTSRQAGVSNEVPASRCVYDGDRDEYLPEDVASNLADEDLATLEEAMVGLDDSLNLSQTKTQWGAGMGPTRTVDTSSETLQDFSTTQPKRSIEPKLYEEDDRGLFDIPLEHVRPQSLRKRSSYKVSESERFAASGTAAEKSLFVTGQSSNPLKRQPIDDHICVPSRPRIEVFEDEVDSDMGLAGDWSQLPEVQTPAANSKPVLPLQRNINRSGEKPTASPGEVKDGQKQVVREETYEQRQKRLWAELPEMEEEYSKYVELIE